MVLRVLKVYPPVVAILVATNVIAEITLKQWVDEKGDFTVSFQVMENYYREVVMIDKTFNVSEHEQFAEIKVGLRTMKSIT